MGGDRASQPHVAHELVTRVRGGQWLQGAGPSLVGKANEKGSGQLSAGRPTVEKPHVLSVRS